MLHFESSSEVLRIVVLHFDYTTIAGASLREFFCSARRRIIRASGPGYNGHDLLGGHHNIHSSRDAYTPTPIRKAGSVQISTNAPGSSEKSESLISLGFGAAPVWKSDVLLSELWLFCSSSGTGNPPDSGPKTPVRPLRKLRSRTSVFGPPSGGFPDLR